MDDIKAFRGQQTFLQFSIIQIDINIDFFLQLSQKTFNLIFIGGIWVYFRWVYMKNLNLIDVCLVFFIFGLLFK